MGHPLQQFLTRPSPHLICYMCGEVAQNAVHDCVGEHPACTDCNAVCPDCGVSAVFQLPARPSLLARRMINSLDIKCTNAVFGCEWGGELDEKAEHDNSCEFQLKPCPQGCAQLVRPAEATKHFENDCALQTVACANAAKIGKICSHLRKDSQTHQTICQFHSCSVPDCQVFGSRDFVDSHQENCKIVHQIRLTYKKLTAALKIVRFENHPPEDLLFNLPKLEQKLLGIIKLKKFSQPTKRALESRNSYYENKIQELEDQIESLEEEKEGLSDTVAVTEEEHELVLKRVEELQEFGAKQANKLEKRERKIQRLKAKISLASELAPLSDSSNASASTSTSNVKKRVKAEIEGEPTQETPKKKGKLMRDGEISSPLSSVSGESPVYSPTSPNYSPLSPPHYH